jgi:hypothetical protein
MVGTSGEAITRLAARSALEGSDRWTGPAAGMPESEDLQDLLLVLDAVVEVIVNPAEMDSTNFLRPFTQRRGSQVWLCGDELEAALKLRLEQLRGGPPVLQPPIRGLTDLPLGPSPHLQAKAQDSALELP